ncbi:MAG: alpha/beta fold hydrolase [Pseudomonadales bacterium]|nr:alpha/beta fold hydrolase [Pseudomonadales bacterium]
MQAQWRTFALAWLIILLGSLLAHSVQTSGDIRIQDLRFAGANGKVLSAYLYIPPGVDAQHPAPGILAIHGYINSREVQSGFAIEFARRGYVVLAMDQAGHGHSDAPAFADGFGGPAGLAYLRSLDIVDKDNIGLEGHSMGGWAVLAAATAYPDGYRAMVLEGSSVGANRSAPGTPEWPRNIAVVFSQFDEFASSMWQVPRGTDVGNSGNLKALFGTTETVIPGQLYGDIPRRTARVLYSPPVTHPGDHLSRTAIGHALEWFGQTLEGGKPLAADRQIWMWKELGTLIALAGFVLLLCGSVRLLLSTPAFAALNASVTSTAWQARSWRWWALLALAALIPVADFYPLMRWGGQLLGASAWFPQTITSQVALWAIVNGLLLTLLGRLPLGGGQVAFTHRVLPSLLLACSTVAIGYGAVLLADFLFQIDFRIWFVGIRPLSLTQLQILPVYLLPFTLFFLLGLRALHGGLSVAGDSALSQYAGNILALAGGFAAFLLLQYGNLFVRGYLLTPAEPLNTIVMIQFVPLLSIVAIISTYTYRRTASYLPGALINALFVSWYIVAGQATQYPV